MNPTLTWDDGRGDYAAARAAALVLRQAAATMEHLQAQLLAAARRLEQAADDAATEQRSRVVARAAWVESVRAATGSPSSRP